MNSLQTGYQLPKVQLTEIVTACGLEPSVRGERLTLEDFARLTNALSAAEQAPVTFTNPSRFFYGMYGILVSGNIM